MERKIHIRFLIISIVTALVAFVLTCVIFHRGFEDQIKNDLKTTAEIISDTITDYENINIDRVSHYRITVIDSSGNVVFDSATDEQNMDNHLERPEIIEANRSGEAFISRQSDTLKTSIYYYAVKLPNQNFLRLSVEADNIYAFFNNSIWVLIVVVLILIILTTVVSSRLTRNIVNPVNKLVDAIIDDKELDLSDKEIYKELVPVIEKLRSQNKQIKQQRHKRHIETDKIYAIIDNMSEGMIFLDMQKNILLINDMAKSFLDCGDIDIGTNILEVNRNIEYNEAIKKGIEGEKCEITQTYSGKILNISVSPVISDGKQIGAVSIAVDITQKAELENMRRDFTANVSHELKTPLTSVTGYAELIENGIARKEDVKKFAGRIRKEATRMLKLIGDIINLSKLDSCNDQDTFTDVDLSSIVKETAESLDFMADQYKVDVEIKTDKCMVRGSKTQLSELVHNLLENAIRYNHENGKAVITAGNGVLTVSDTGLGIPKADCDRVFERFYRVDKSRSKDTGGTGLGLAIVKHIALNHNAKISLESEVGKGTKITIDFKN